MLSKLLLLTILILGLEVPASVPEHQLVRVKAEPLTQETVSDLEVFTVPSGSRDIVWIETARTTTGEWVFTGPPGEYTVKLTTFTNGEVRKEVAVTRILPKEPGPDPGPLPPGPKPPTPEPEPPKGVFVTLIPEWSVEVVSTNKIQEAKAMEAVFSKMADVALDYQSGPELAQATAEELSKSLGAEAYLLWRPVRTKISEKLPTIGLKTMEDHKRAWKDIAAGFGGVK